MPDFPVSEFAQNSVASVGGFQPSSQSSRSGRLPNQRWAISPIQVERTHQIAQATHLSPLLAQVLLNRGISTAQQAQEFLSPESQLLPSPLEEFPDLPLSLELLLNAIALHQKIAICGDYDADGMTSTALLLRALRFLGANVDYAIPSRMQEGYGINQRIVEEFYEEGVGLILTVDNGIAAYEPIVRARQLGLTVIVTDHHDVPPQLPPANAILNPKLIQEDSPYRSVAGVGVAYVLAVCLAQCLQKTQDLTTPLIELFTLGTIADLAPLTGVNRRWVRRGLKLLPRSRLAGVQALVQVAGLGDQVGGLKPEAIGFRLGPRINAVGRLADPQIVIELLTTDDDGVALERAMQCEQINQYRQRLCELIEAEAIAWCELNQPDLQQDRVLVIVQPDWHHGVIGIVASRLVERYGVPVFIGTYEDESQQLIRGSARSIPEFNVFDALHFSGDLLEKFGGHRAAGGFSFKAEKLEEVRSRLATFARQHLAPEHLKPLIIIDAQASFYQLDLDLFTQIDNLHPCGIENPDPVFWTPNVRVIEQKTIGREQAHLKLTLGQNSEGHLPNRMATLKAIAWRWGEYYPLPNRIDVAYRLRVNEWNGTKTVELELVGVRLPAQPGLVPPVTPPVKETTSELTFPPPAQRQTFTTQLPIDVPTDALTVDTKNSAITVDLQNHETVADSPSVSATVRSFQPKVEFYYSKRKYSCSISKNGTTKELKIKNPEGQILVIQPSQRKGLLGRKREDAQEVDVFQPYYFNLIRAALNALEISEKSQLILEKDQLIEEKDKQIETLNQQLALLDQKFSQLSTEQQQKFQSLQLELQERKTAIQDHENHISQLQSQLSQDIPRLDPEAAKRQVKTKLGDSVWFCLNQRSQKDLCSAYKNYDMIRAEGFTAQISDYSEAGLRLGFAVEREIIHPFFKDLYQFSLTNGGPEIGGIVLGHKKKYTLGMLPPLLSEQWYSFRDDCLKRKNPSPEDDLYCTISFGNNHVNQADRQLIKKFLKQWDHPLSNWFSRGEISAASTVDQINKLRNIAAHAESFLYEWQFDLLHALVVGSDTQRGLFREIYGN